MTHQLGLDLTGEPDFSLAAFLPFQAAQAALHNTQNFPQGAGDFLLLIAPSGAGKTHLLKGWCTKTGAPYLSPPDLTAHDATTTPPLLAVDDIESLNPTQQQSLFHIINHIYAVDGALLLAAQKWPLENFLPDLTSRINRMHHVVFTPPTHQADLALLLLKEAERLGATLTPDVLEVLTTQAPRSVKGLLGVLKRAIDTARTQNVKFNAAFVRSVLSQ